MIRFTVEVEPMGAPRMTQRDKWLKRPCVMRYRKLKDAIRDAAPALPATSDIQSVHILAVFSPPVSWSNKKRTAALGTLHRSKPDADNIAKGVLDTLFSDDAGIAILSVEKRWGMPERLEIIIETNEEIHR